MAGGHHMRHAVQTFSYWAALLFVLGRQLASKKVIPMARESKSPVSPSGASLALTKEKMNRTRQLLGPADASLHGGLH